MLAPLPHPDRRLTAAPPLQLLDKCLAPLTQLFPPKIRLILKTKPNKYLVELDRQQHKSVI